MSEKDLQKVIKELKRIIQEKDKQHQEIIQKIIQENKKLKKKLAMWKTKYEKQSKKLRKYENPHTLSMIKTYNVCNAKKEESDPERKQGAPKGHDSHIGKDTADYDDARNTVTECPHCKSPDFTTIKEQTRKITDTETTVRITRIKHIDYESKCNNCHKTFETKSGAPNKGNFGKNIKQQVIAMFLNRLPYRQIAHELNRMGVFVSFATVYNIIKGIGLYNLDLPAQNILKKIRNAKILHIDETSFSLNGHNVWIWVFLDPTNNNVFYAIRPSRGANVLDEILPNWNGTVVADGWRAYNKFTTQRCWAHIMREMEFVDNQHDTPSTNSMRKQLADIFEQAKIDSKCIKLADRKKAVQKLQYRTKKLITQYGNNWRFDGFLTKLENALPNLFRFVIDKKIPNNNNAAERALRELVVHRKIRGSMRADNTIKWLGNLFTCVTTWQHHKEDILANMAKYT